MNNVEKIVDFMGREGVDWFIKGDNFGVMCQCFGDFNYLLLINGEIFQWCVWVNIYIKMFKL